MKIGFDLDGTLDRPAMAELVRALLKQGHEVHIITAIFLEAGSWQTHQEKRAKLARLNVPFVEWPSGCPNRATLHIMEAMPETYPRDYRLTDIGMRKGALCEQLGIEMYFDDSATYCETMKAMHGGLTVLHVR